MKTELARLVPAAAILTGSVGGSLENPESHGQNPPNSNTIPQEITRREESFIILERRQDENPYLVLPQISLGVIAGWNQESAFSFLSESETFNNEYEKQRGVALGLAEKTGISPLDASLYIHWAQDPEGEVIVSFLQVQKNPSGEITSVFYPEEEGYAQIDVTELTQEGFSLTPASFQWDGALVTTLVILDKEGLVKGAVSHTGIEPVAFSTDPESVPNGSTMEPVSWEASVIAGSLNVRSTPEIKQNNIVGFVNYGEKVIVTGITPDQKWYQIIILNDNNDKFVFAYVSASDQFVDPVPVPLETKIPPIVLVTNPNAPRHEEQGSSGEEEVDTSLKDLEMHLGIDAITPWQGEKAIDINASISYTTHNGREIITISHNGEVKEIAPFSVSSMYGKGYRDWITELRPHPLSPDLIDTGEINGVFLGIVGTTKAHPEIYDPMTGEKMENGDFGDIEFTNLMISTRLDGVTPAIMIVTIPPFLVTGTIPYITEVTTDVDFLSRLEQGRRITLTFDYPKGNPSIVAHELLLQYYDPDGSMVHRLSFLQDLQNVSPGFLDLYRELLLNPSLARPPVYMGICFMIGMN